MSNPLSRPWNRLKIYPKGEIVSYKNGYYTNKNGKNEEPSIDSQEWIYNGEINPFFSLASINASNITGDNLAAWKAIFDGEANFKIGIADDGTLDNGFDVPIEDLLTLAFSGLDFEYELDEENGTILIKSKNSGGTGDYIPLIGTEEDKPVTGPIKVVTGISTIVCDTDNLSVLDISENYSILNGKLVYIGNINDLKNYLQISDSDGFIIYDNVQNRGLSADSYYGENYDDNTYIQKKYVDKSNSYSTDEIKTGGTWIDGKPIYRKVITENVSSDIYSFLIQDLEELVKPIQGTSNYKNIPYNETDNDGANISNKQLRIQYVGDNTFEINRYETNYVLLTGTFSAQSLSVGSFTIILEYTKTTD